MYSTWSVKQLKEQLLNRKASTSGKKGTLIERLEAYDRNDLIGVEDELDDEMPDFPAIEVFRDVNASTNLPVFSKYHIQEFAERFQVPPKGRLLYESRSLVTLRVAFEGNDAYFKRDEEFINEMIVHLTSFYEEYLQPLIFNKYIYRNYDSVIKPN